jgi:glutaredoxin-related protein
MSKKTKPMEKHLEDAIKNIKQDRAVTATLLTDLMVHMQKQGHHTHETCGLIASKYVETLQRSNEQLVKLVSILQKDQVKKTSFSSDEKNEIFDILQEEQERGDDE